MISFILPGYSIKNDRHALFNWIGKFLLRWPYWKKKTLINAIKLTIYLFYNDRLIDGYVWANQYFRDSRSVAVFLF